MQDDVTGLLLTTPYPHEVIFAQELRKYDPILAKIRANFAEQSKLLETISVKTPSLPLLVWSVELVFGLNLS
jgi:hypothetical protein